MCSAVNLDVGEIRAVSILEMSGNGKEFGLKLEVVEEIFKSVKNLPVAIISVSGALREGKSFILNLLLHYLVQQNKWHSDRKRKTYNVFKSKNGTESETVGINITNKPILLRDKDDKTVAVFLMDTEGLFDKERDAKECSTVFAMSCLLSSFQIFNVFRQLQESNLQHLQIFCNYAMAAGGRKKKSATTGAPFQALMFLIRDWAHRNIDCSRTGAQRYLSEFLETNKDENKLVRDQIRNSFSDVRCHLLPRPGDEVEWKNGNEIYVSDIKDNFIEGVDDLGEQLFKTENLIAKQLNGITITGQGFVDLTIAYAAILHDGKMPKADCILKANHQVFVLDRTRHMESQYIEAMKEKTGKYIKPNELEKLHKEYLHRALQQHKEMVKYIEPDKKDEEQLGTIQAHMMGRLNTTFQALQHENEAKKKVQIKDLKECISNAGKSYKELLKRAAGGVYLEDVSGPCEIAQQEIMADFYKCTHEYDQDIVQECMVFYNQTIKAKNKEFLNKNLQRKESIEKSLKGLVSDTVEKYAEMMDLGVERPGQGIDFSKLKENAFAESVRIFEQSDVGRGYKCRQTELENLKAKLKENDAKYWERFCMYRDTELLNAVKEAEKLYKKYVNTELTQDTFLEEVELTSRHRKATDAAMVALKDIQYHRDEAFVQQCRESITEKLTDQLELMQKNNKLFQEKASARFKEGRREVVKVVFVKAFEDNQEKYIEEDELQIILQKLKEEAMQKYYLLRGPPEKEFKANEQELLQVIQNKIEEIMACNNNNKEKIINAIDTFYDLLMSDYGMKINEITSNRYANKENLKKLHEEFKQLVVQEMVKAIPFKNIQQDAINKCSDGLDNKLKYWAEHSTRWKSFKENVKNGATTGAILGAGFLGFVGAGIAGLAGGLVGGVAGVAKTAMTFKYDLSVEEMRSIKHLQSLNLAENVYDSKDMNFEQY